MAKQVVSLISGPAGCPIISERLAGVAGILPSHLVSESGGNVVLNTAADVLSQKLFAQKNLCTAGGIEQAYELGELVSYGAYHAGQQVVALLAAGAAAVSDGDPLTSAGDGTLKLGTPANAIAYALGSVDNSGSAEVAQIQIRIA